jgi:hypothetical protein
LSKLYIKVREASADRSEKAPLKKVCPKEIVTVSVGLLKILPQAMVGYATITQRIGKQQEQ